jgi:hypothetical protein
MRQLGGSLGTIAKANDEGVRHAYTIPFSGAPTDRIDESGRYLATWIGSVRSSIWRSMDLESRLTCRFGSLQSLDHLKPLRGTKRFPDGKPLGLRRLSGSPILQGRTCRMVGISEVERSCRGSEAIVQTAPSRLAGSSVHSRSNGLMDWADGLGNKRFF